MVQAGIARALMNFVLESNDYLGLVQRNTYLDAIAQRNNKNHAPLVSILYDIYTKQHDKVLGDMPNRVLKGGGQGFS